MVVKLINISEYRDAEETLTNEFEMGQTLREGGGNCFIKFYCIVNGKDGEIIACEGSGDDTSSYAGIVMERGTIDLFKWLNENKGLLDFASKIFISSTLCSTIYSSHKVKIVLMDVKDNNFVRVFDENTSNVYIKEVDFDSCVKFDTDITNTAAGTILLFFYEYKSLN